ncbi:MAG: hypothetical protein HOW73_13075 [Polyangiaceae bacterium]|nr:hypothetical protein [Polyangiaceae bacterium]
MTTPARIAVPGVTGPAAQIHDQGYERYTGSRSEQNGRFFIVAGNVVSQGLRRWVVRVPLIFSAIITVFMIGGMLIGRLVPGAAKRGLEFGQLAVGAGWILGWWAMVIGAGIGCSTIVDDLRVGAFQFYFSRSLRTLDYGAGKVLGVLFLVALPMFVVPTLLSLVGVALSSDADEAAKHWPMIPRAIVWGALGAAVYTLPALGFGAAIVSKRAAQAGYVVYYLLAGAIANGLARVTKIPQLQLLAFDHCWINAGRWLFDVPAEARNLSPPPPAWQSLAAIGVFCGLGAFGLYLRLRKAEVSMVGGGS